MAYKMSKQDMNAAGDCCMTIGTPVVNPQQVVAEYIAQAREEGRQEVWAIVREQCDKMLQTAMGASK